MCSRYLNHLHWKKSSETSVDDILTETVKEEFEFPNLPLPTKRQVNADDNKEELQREDITNRVADIEAKAEGTLGNFVKDCGAGALGKDYGAGALSKDCGAGTLAKDCGAGANSSISVLNKSDDLDPWESNTVQESEDFWNNSTTNTANNDNTDTETDPWACTDPKESEDFWNTAENEVHCVSTVQESEMDTGSSSLTAEAQGHVQFMTKHTTHSSDQDDQQNMSNESRHSQEEILTNLNCESDLQDQSQNKLQTYTQNDPRNIVSDPDDLDNDPKCELELDPRCLSDEENGNLYVVEDSDYSDGEELAITSKTKWRPVIKKDPAPVKEVLQLTLEEVS